jgi:hypothetical protein
MGWKNAIRRWIICSGMSIKTARYRGEEVTTWAVDDAGRVSAVDAAMHPLLHIGQFDVVIKEVRCHNSAGTFKTLWKTKDGCSCSL